MESREKKLKEEFLTVTKTIFKQEKKPEVFETPLRPREFSAIAKSNGKLKAIRFIADNNTKKIYIFPPDVFHSDAEKDILKEIKDLAERVDRDALWGVAVFKQGKWEIDSSDTRWKDELEVKDFKWMEKQGFRVPDIIDNNVNKKNKNNPRNIAEVKKKAATVSEETYLINSKIIRENLFPEKFNENKKEKNMNKLDEAVKKLSKEITKNNKEKKEIKTLKFPFTLEDVIKPLKNKNISAVRFDRATGKPEIRSRLISIINVLQRKGYYIYSTGNGEYVVKREEDKPY